MTQPTKIVDIQIPVTAWVRIIFAIHLANAIALAVLAAAGSVVFFGLAFALAVLGASL